jgi:hypothetical protein
MSLNFYIVRLRGNDEYYIHQQEGEQLIAKLLDKNLSEPFLEFEDVSGSSICVQTYDIQAVILSTEDIRKKDMEGDLHLIRLALGEVIRVELEDKRDWTPE